MPQIPNLSKPSANSSRQSKLHIETARGTISAPQTHTAAKTMRLAARNWLILPAVSSALKFQQQQAPKAPAAAMKRRQVLTLPAAALALPQSARADGQAWAGPRWAEVDAKLPTNDQARVFRDLEDGFEVACPPRRRIITCTPSTRHLRDGMWILARVHFCMSTQTPRAIGCARSRSPNS